MSLDTKYGEECKNCGHKFFVSAYQIIDADSNENAGKDLIEGKTVPFECPSCGEPSSIRDILFYSYWSKGWVHLVVPFDSNTPASFVLNQAVLLFSHTKQNRKIPKNVGVQSCYKDLEETIRTEDIGFYWQNLAELQLPRWDDEKSSLVFLSNAFIEANVPIWAFLTVSSCILDVPELYLFKEIRNAFRLSFLAIGDRELSQFGLDITSAELVEDIRSEMDQHIFSYPAMEGATLYHEVPDLGRFQPSGHGGTISRSNPNMFDQIKVWLRLIIAVKEAQRREIYHKAYFALSFERDIGEKWDALNDNDKAKLKPLYDMAMRNE